MIQQISTGHCLRILTLQQKYLIYFSVTMCTFVSFPTFMQIHYARNTDITYIQLWNITVCEKSIV
jgi:hypothetical protein